MTYFQRYMSGECIQVHEEIYLLGKHAFAADRISDVEKVLTETFTRVAYNLDIIYKELKLINYLFTAKPKHNFEKPLHKPLPDTEELLKQLENAVKHLGYIPLSLKFFYRIVGGVNFVWDYDMNSDFLWNMADPIQVASLDSVVKEFTDEYGPGEFQVNVHENDSGYAFIYLSADDLHKDNVSGGEAYAIQLPKEPSVDSRFLNEPNKTTFINYLRICFENCGFPGITRPDMQNNYESFFATVKPQLKSI